MPSMHVRPSGGIVFRSTPEEQLIRDQRKVLNREVDEVRKLKAELEKTLKKLNSVLDEEK
jgi:prefoldin subunit 5